MLGILITWVASLLTIALVLPQTIKAVTEGEYEHLSFNKYLIVCSASLLWFIHGITVKDATILFGSFVCGVCSGVILYLKFTSGKKPGSIGRGMGGGIRKSTSVGVRRRRF